MMDGEGEVTYGQMLQLADTASIHSDDPDTQVGAVLVGTNSEGQRVLIHGSNALPNGAVADAYTNRKDCLHAEIAVLTYAAGAGVRTTGGFITVSRFPCYDCCAALANAGVNEVVCRSRIDELPDKRLEYRMDEGFDLLQRCSIEVMEMTGVPVEIDVKETH